jgi:hypothetical protein
MIAATVVLLSACGAAEPQQSQASAATTSTTSGDAAPTQIHMDSGAAATTLTTSGDAAPTQIHMDSGAGPCAVSPLSGGGSTAGPDGSLTSLGPPDGASDGPCGPGGQCFEGPFCTPGGCVEANTWVCVVTSNGPCRAEAGLLKCGKYILDSGTID